MQQQCLHAGQQLGRGPGNLQCHRGGALSEAHEVFLCPMQVVAAIVHARYQAVESRT